MIDTDNTGINFGRIATLAVVATFPGLRRFIGVMGLLGLIAAGVLGDKAAHPVTTTVNPNPVCDREFFLPISQNYPVGDGIVKSVGADHPSYYRREARGTGWCLIKRDETQRTKPSRTADGRLVDLYVNRWYEVPSKYGQNVQALAPVSQETSLIAIGIGLASGVILLGIWLPATIMAAVGRRWLKDIRE